MSPVVRKILNDMSRDSFFPRDISMSDAELSVPEGYGGIKLRRLGDNNQGMHSTMHLFS